jgi:hypothetical protein
MEYPFGCSSEGSCINTARNVNASAGEEHNINNGPAKNPNLHQST